MTGYDQQDWAISYVFAFGLHASEPFPVILQQETGQNDIVLWYKRADPTLYEALPDTVLDYSVIVGLLWHPYRETPRGIKDILKAEIRADRPDLCGMLRNVNDDAFMLWMRAYYCTLAEQ
jgi:hypothetical protein